MITALVSIPNTVNKQTNILENNEAAMMKGVHGVCGLSFQKSHFIDYKLGKIKEQRYAERTGWQQSLEKTGDFHKNKEGPKTGEQWGLITRRF